MFSVGQVQKAEEGGITRVDSSVLHPNLDIRPTKIVSAHGNHLVLEDGQRIFDATGGPAVACLGYAHPRVHQAIEEQLKKVTYCYSLYWANDAAEELAKLLIDSTDRKMARATMVGSGSEAMEAAMKVSRQYFLELSPPQPQRNRFIARDGSFHGTTIASLSLTGREPAKSSFRPLMNNNVSHVSRCHPYRDRRVGESLDQYVQRLADELEAEFLRVGPESVCAFVIEPVAGSQVGCTLPPPGYLRAVQSVCQKYGALLIFDEVICGLGRTGYYHAWQADNVVPDVQIVAKALGGGYMPVSAVLYGHGVVEAIRKGSGFFNHGHTYQSHAVACAAAAAIQRTIQEDDLITKVRALGHRLEAGLLNALGNHPHVCDIRGRGLFWAIEFAKDKKTKEPFPESDRIAMGLRNRALRKPHNMSLWPLSGCADGTLGDHIMITPAYTTTEDEIDFIVRTISGVVHEYFASRTVNCRATTVDEAPRLTSTVRRLDTSRLVEVES